MGFLLKLFLCVFIPIFCFGLYARRFANPYKNTFIFGKKGSGKSTLMIKYMLKYKRKGWNIYTDIKDCIVPGVRIIRNAHELSNFIPEKNSALFLDEVGISFDNRGYKDFSGGLRDFFKLQRKYKIAVFQNSQAYDVDKKIRDCVDGMLLQSCISGVIGITRPIYKSVTLTAPDGDHESRIAEQLKFAPIWKWKLTWLPRYFKYFDSFDAPPRPPIRFTEISQESYQAKQELRRLNRSANRKHRPRSRQPKANADRSVDQ